jgi:RNA polymerase sigma-70 factor (ECF subfamily)
MHGDLIQQCRAGDQDAHYKIYRLYSKAMYNVSFRILGREEDAEDALQEGFTSAFKNLRSYRGDSTFGAWLKRIVVNKAINILKKRREVPLPEVEGWDVAEDNEAVEYKEEFTVERVRSAIQQLPDGYRTVLSLYLLEGYDHQEIAEILSITESTSKSQLNRAKNKLKDFLMIKAN